MTTLDTASDRVSGDRPLPEGRPLRPGRSRIARPGPQTYLKLEKQIGRVIIGQEAIIRSIVAAVFRKDTRFIIGVPGLAKTLLVKTVAQVLSWSFKRIQTSRPT